MKNFFRALLICVVSVTALQGTGRAQDDSLNVTAGVFHIVLDPGWVASVQALGVTITSTDYKHKGDIEGFPVVSGDLDGKTGAGDVRSNGKFTLTAGSMKLELMGLTLDTANPAYPVITAMITLNGVYQGRMHVFGVVSGQPYKLPFKPGTSKSSTGYFKGQQFLKLLQLPIVQLAPDAMVGSFVMEVTTQKQ